MINSKSLFNTVYELLKESEKNKIEITQILQEQENKISELNEYHQKNDLFQKELKNKQVQIENKNANLEEANAKIINTQNTYNKEQIEIKEKLKFIEENQKTFQNRQNIIETNQKDFWPVGSIYQTFDDKFDPNSYWGRYMDQS